MPPIFNQPIDSALVGTDLYVLDGKLNQIIVVDTNAPPSGGRTVFPAGGAGLVEPVAMILDPDGLRLWVADNGLGTLTDFSLAGVPGMPIPYPVGTTEVVDMAFDQGDEIWFYGLFLCFRKV